MEFSWAVEMLHQWLQSFCGAQRVGPGIEPYGKHSLKEGRIPMDIEISGKLDLIPRLPCREIENSHRIDAIIWFRRASKYTILENYHRFEWDIDIRIQRLIAIIFGFFTTLTQPGACMPPLESASNEWIEVTRIYFVARGHIHSLRGDEDPREHLDPGLGADRV